LRGPHERFGLLFSVSVLALAVPPGRDGPRRAGVARGEERLDLFARQVPPAPLAQAADRQRSDADPLEALHLRADPRQHAAHLAVLAFADRDLERGLLRGALQYDDARAGGATIGEVHALADALDLLVEDASRDLDELRLRHTEARV
jgi:hypothetical protein